MKSPAQASRNSLEHIVYIFEGFRLDAARRQLSSSGGVVVPLNSRAMEALVLLVSRGGDLVTKRQLLEGVWPGAVVEDNNINQCILAIRKALGETAGTNRFIMTVPGRGYRFVALVTAQTRETPEEPVPAPRASRPASRWLVATVVLAVSLLLGVGVMNMQHRPPSAIASEESPDLVLQLRRRGEIDASPAASLLLACLRQRPDLHLQIDVHVVGSAQTPPIWTGQFMAGAEDVLPGRKAVDPDHHACQHLPAMP